MTDKKVLKIGIDTLPIVRNASGGGERYVDNLLKTLAEIDQTNQYYIFAHPSYTEFVESLGKNFLLVELDKFNNKTAYRTIGQQLIVPWKAKKNKLHLLHSMGSLSPFYTPCPSVVSILFVVNFTQPHLFPPYYKRVYFNYAMAKSAKKAKKIICVSNDEKQQVEKYLNVPSDKIEVIYFGVDKQFNISSATEENLNKISCLGIKRPYILSTSAFAPLKNTETMVKVYHILKEKYNIPHQFALTGVPNNYNYLSKIKGYIKELNEEDNILVLGNVPKDILPVLYSSADLFLFLSLTETFGLPLIEAMASGVPIVTSNREALPEIAGEAALIVDAMNIDEAVSATYKALSDKRLKNEMIKKGLERAKMFSWEKATRKLLSIYQEIGYNQSDNSQ